MKKKVVDKSKQVVIHTERRTTKVWDDAAVMNIDSGTIYSKFEEAYTKHKDKVLDLVISRMALNSALTEVQKKLQQVSPDAIEVIDEETQNRIDFIYEKALFAHAANSALSSLNASDELKQELLMNIFESKAATTPKDKDGMPIGIRRTKDSPDNKSLDQLRELLESKLNREDQPYGDNRKYSPSGGKLPVASNPVVVRKSRRSHK